MNWYSAPTCRITRAFANWCAVCAAIPSRSTSTRICLFQWLVEELKPPRDRSRTPLFQVVFDLHNIPLELNLQGTKLTPIRLPLRPAKFDLTLFISETPQDSWALLEYNTDLYDRTTAQRLLGDYHSLLAAVTTAPDTPVFDLAVPTGCARS